MGGGEGALQVHPHHGVEVTLGHGEEHGVAHDAGVVDEHVEVAELVDRLAHQVGRPGPVRHVVVVGGRLATSPADDVGDLLGGALVHPLAADRAPYVVDHDRGPLAGKLERLTPADAVAGAGDDRHLAVEQSHGVLSLSLGSRVPSGAPLPVRLAGDPSPSPIPPSWRAQPKR